jgi:hypothetical protein
VPDSYTSDYPSHYPSHSSASEPSHLIHNSHADPSPLDTSIAALVSLYMSTAEEAGLADLGRKKGDGDVGGG